MLHGIEHFYFIKIKKLVAIVTWIPELLSDTKTWATHRQHGLGPLPMAPLQQFDALQIGADLHEVPNGDL